MTRRFAMCLLAAALFSLPAQAKDDPAIANETARLFSGFCLGTFPDENEFAALLKKRNATAMTPQELKRYIDKAPGKGWYIHAPGGLYAVTLERLKVPVCSLRRMTPKGIPTVKEYLAATHAYASIRKGTLGKTIKNKRKTPDGADLIAYSTPMKDSKGDPTDMFSVIVTNYHGNPPQEWKDEAQGGDGVEIRMVHHLIRQDGK